MRTLLVLLISAVSLAAQYVPQPGKTAWKVFYSDNGEGVESPFLETEEEFLGLLEDIHNDPTKELYTDEEGAFVGFYKVVFKTFKIIEIETDPVWTYNPTGEVGYILKLGYEDGTEATKFLTKEEAEQAKNDPKVTVLYEHPAAAEKLTAIRTVESLTRYIIEE